MKLHAIKRSAAIFLSALALQAHAGELHTFTSDAAGFNTHSMWYDDGQEVTVIDAQFTPQHARQLLDDIRAHSKSPITRVIVTHPNPDKFNGLSVFHRAGVDSIASAATAAAMPGVDAYKRYFWVKVAKAFSEASYPVFQGIRHTFSGQQTITLKSGETLSLIELPHAGISSTQTVVRIDQSGDLIVGDLVHARHHAWLEGGIVDGKPRPDLDGWRMDLRTLPTLGQGKVYGGRGAVLPIAQAVSEQIGYLDRVEQIVDDYLQALGDRRGELTDDTKKAGHYKRIQEQVALAFPEYAFPDMVGYSIYGLINQKLERSGAGSAH